MTGETETRDHALGEMLERIPVPPLRPIALERLARARGASTPGTRRRWRPRRSRLTLATASVTAVGIALAIGLTLSGTKSPTTTSESGSTPGSTPPLGLGGAATDVRTLYAFKRVVNARSALPRGMSETLQRFGSRLGESPTSIAEPIIGPPSIYLVTFEPNQICTGISSFTASAWGCGESLRQAGGSLLIRDVILRGRRFVYGLAANDVTSITIASEATPTNPGTSEQAQLANNAFVASLPYQGGLDLGAVAVTATRTDGSTATANLPGTTGPLGLAGNLINHATGAPGAADASKKHVLITSGDATLLDRATIRRHRLLRLADHPP